MKRADSLISPIIKNLGIEEAVRLSRIRKEWRGIFEKPVSLHTFPASLREKVLLINVDSPVWMQQLNFFKEEILGRLGGFGIKEVRFKIGRIAPEKDDSAAVARKRKPLAPGDADYIADTVSSIRDNELKCAISKAIERSIGSYGAVKNRRQV